MDTLAVRQQDRDVAALSDVVAGIPPRLVVEDLDGDDVRVERSPL